jgi:hypothetical protein
MGYNDFDSIEDEDFGEEEFDEPSEFSPEMEDELDNRIYEAIHRVAREQFRNRKK